MQPYIAAFLLPSSVTKRLTEDGWEFASPTRLPESLLDVLTSTFELRYVETYLGLDVFQGDGLKITVARDSSGEIENVFVQLRGRSPAELRSCVADARLDGVEVFVPSE
jgi:hypothetical protein